MPVWSIALAFFLITNAIGNSPAILALVKDFSIQRQRQILLRETLISIAMAIFFLFAGKWFLGLLQVEMYTVSFTGGIILVLTAFYMIFPHTPSDEGVSAVSKEPFLVPIAMPLLTGGGLISTIMYYSHLEQNNLKIFAAISISSAATLIILLIAPRLQTILGKRGMLALEQLMGMVLLLMAMELNVRGTYLFIQSLG